MYGGELCTDQSETEKLELFIWTPWCRNAGRLKHIEWTFTSLLFLFLLPTCEHLFRLFLVNFCFFLRTCNFSVLLSLPVFPPSPMSSFFFFLKFMYPTLSSFFSQSPSHTQTHGTFDLGSGTSKLSYAILDLCANLPVRLLFSTCSPADCGERCVFSSSVHWRV